MSQQHDEMAARQQWAAEAAEKITVADRGSIIEVQVEGHEVARYLTWAALVTKADQMVAAEEYAAKLRVAYVALADGSKVSA